MIVLINAYFGVLTSLLTVPKLELIVNTIEEVAKSNVLRVTVEKNADWSYIYLVTYTYTQILYKIQIFY